MNTQGRYEEYERLVPVKCRVRLMPEGVQVVVLDAVVKLGKEFLLKEFQTERELFERIGGGLDA